MSISVLAWNWNSRFTHLEGKTSFKKLKCRALSINEELFVTFQGESDDCLARLAKRDGIIAK